MAEHDMSSLLAELDTGDMAGFTRSFVDDLEAAMAMDTGIEADSDWSGVICLGMGGSGAGGRFLKSLADSEGGLPFVVWSDYGLPSWWGPDWLVLATSYSGDTEETLDGVHTALESGGTVIGVSSGGRLSEMLEDSDECAMLSVPPGQAPRSAFGHIFGAQLAACWTLGLLPSPNSDEISGMLDRLRPLRLGPIWSEETACPRLWRGPCWAGRSESPPPQIWLRPATASPVRSTRTRTASQIPPRCPR